MALDFCCSYIGLVFIKDRPVSSFWVLRFRVLGVFVFEFWVLRFRVLGCFVFDLGCFVFEIWVLRFRDVGASCFGLRFRVLRSRNYPRRTRKRNITWYNPPFDNRVKTNLGKNILRIVCECFPRGHALRPIFNRNTIKLSYSLMPNVKSTIDAHNKRLLKQTNPSESLNDASLCNYRTTFQPSSKVLFTLPVSSFD